MYRLSQSVLHNWQLWVLKKINLGLFCQVFHQEDAYEASKIMLGDDPCKPTVYDKVSL